MGAPQYEQAGADIGGTGTTNTIPRWTGASTLGDSGLIDNGTAIYTTTRNVGIGTASPNAILSVYNASTPTISLWNSSNFTRFSTNTNDCFIDVGLGGTAGALIFRRSSSATESARIDSAGNFAVGRVPTAGTIFETQGDQVTFRDAAGNVRFRFEAANSLVNVGIGAGWGLKLPATPGNPDTQTLDAYQEIGTGTPVEIALTLTCGTSGTITVNAASSKARVTRVGNKVIGHGRIVVSSVSAPLGRLSCTLTGCPQPFTNFLVETQTDNTTGLASGNRIVGTSDTAATPTIYFDRYSPNTSSTDAAANIQAGTIIVFNICYSV